MKTVKIFLIFSIITINTKKTFAQTDPGNEGQLKRMVYDQWDDWKPDPGTHFFGTIPNNPIGFAWWRILYNKYYKGPDLRPYRTDGPFMRNTLSLKEQQDLDSKIQDTANKLKDMAISTDLNMEGGSLDVVYDAYYKHKFSILTTEWNDYIQNVLQVKSPLAYNRVISSKIYTSYLEELDVLTSRISAVHNSYEDKGKRILSYMDIKQQLEFNNSVLGNYINTYAKVLSSPDLDTLHTATIYNNDAEIIKHIMSTYNF